MPRYAGEDASLQQLLSSNIYIKHNYFSLWTRRELK
jgi:hypothetical protein